MEEKGQVNQQGHFQEPPAILSCILNLKAVGRSLRDLHRLW